MSLTRRDLMKSGLAASTALAAGMPLAAERTMDKKPFKLKYAPHFGMFENSAGKDSVDQLKFAADEGFNAWEDNGMKGRDKAEQERIAKAMIDLKIEMGIFVANDIEWNTPTLTTGQPEFVDKFLADIKSSIEVAKRMNAKWMTVVPGTVAPRLHMGYQTAYVVEALRKASALLEPHGLVMVIEVLNFRDHPHMFLTHVGQGYEICRAVNSPACKVLFDMYHAQIEEGNIIPNIDLAYSEVGYYQIGDNPGRNEPTTGETNFHNVFKHLHGKGYTGILGMEHGASKPGKEGERAVIDAYRWSDDF